jgi:predicted O-methyltransferase YrrM
MSAIRDRIIELYSERYLRKSATRHDDMVIFKRLLAGKGYRTILEIGTYRGCTAAEMSQYCDRVVTIDLVHGQIERDEPSIDRRTVWDSIGAKNIELVLVNDDAEKKRVIDALEFDFAFVDGAHYDQAVRFDFALVKRCGRVLFHDYDNRGPPNRDDIYRFVNSLSGNVGGTVVVDGVFAMWTA